MTPAEAAARLRRSLYGSRAGPRCPTIFQDIAGEPLGADARGDLVNRLATTVPQIRCVLGKDAYRDGADTWLRALSLDYGAALP